MRGDLFVGVADMATLLAERLASSSSAGRPSPVCCRHRDRWQTSFEKTLTEHMFLQTLRCYEGFRASAPRQSVHVCRQATQVSLAADLLLGLGLFGKLFSIMMEVHCYPYKLHVCRPSGGKSLCASSVHVWVVWKSPTRSVLSSLCNISMAWDTQQQRPSLLRR